MNIIIFEVLMTVFFDGVKIPIGSTVVYYNNEGQIDSFHTPIKKGSSEAFDKNPDVFKRIY
jgi:hypothetical protein